MLEVKETELYDSFVKLVRKLTNMFQTREDALSQRNVLEKWTELDILYDLFIKKLDSLDKAIPEKLFLKPLVLELGLHCIGLPESAFITKYLELERCMIEPIDEPRVWCYLYPFECSRDIIDLDGPLRIRRATLLERVFHLQNKPPMGDNPSFIAETKSGLVQSALRDYHEDSEKFGYHLKLLDEPPYGDDFFTLISILRLSKPNPIGYDSLMFQENRGSIEYRATYQVSPWKHPCTLGIIRNQHLNLEDNEINDMIIMWNYFHLAISNQDKKSSNRLKSAIRRYELVICSNEIEDAIVDSVITLETIFAVGGKRLANRASKLIGANEEAREKLYQIIKSAQKMRNQIVHGSELTKSDDKVNRYLLGILRQILVSAIVLSKDGVWFAELIREAVKNPERMNKVRKTISKWLIK